MFKCFFTRGFNMLLPVGARIHEAIFASETSMTPESEKVQRVLDDAFGKFRHDHPEVVQAIEAMNVSFAQYLAVLSAQTTDPQTTSGNAQTPA
jgi:hypothetical protein